MQSENPSRGMPCVNCQKNVPPQDAKIFQKVFVCGECYDTAERLYKRLERELLQIRSILAETVRLLLVQRLLHVGVAHVGPGETKASVLKLLSFLVSLKSQPKGEPADAPAQPTQD